jgi:cystathionine beta-synthase
VDVLVTVGGAVGPPRLAAGARHEIAVAGPDVPPDVVAALRAGIPQAVGVVGPPELAAAVATQLHHAGLPVTLYTDEAVHVESGVDVRPVQDQGAPMQAANSLIDLFGHTPLVRMDRIGRDLSCHLLAKLEYLNPGGSVKDRPAIAMIEAAEADGRLKAGGTIVEPTSGNTGVGLAVVAARRRYRCVFTMPDKIATEKVQLLRAFGAEVIVCPTAVAPEHPESYYSVAKRLAETIPGAFQPDQYHNPANPASHAATTGPELWEQTAGRITHFVAGIGTGGTISGVGRYLKSQNPSIQIVGADPEGSVYSGGSGRPYLVEGIGEDFWPGTYDPSVVDRVIMVSDRDSFLMARRTTREEGILAGGSCGTAIWAAVELGRELGPDDVIVVLLPDSGRGYLSKIYNDEWMSDYGFIRAGGETVAEVMGRKTRDLPPLVHVHPDETVRSAISLLKEFGVSQMPVVKAEPPLALAEVVGSVSDRSLLDRAFHDPSVVDRPLLEVMEPPLPTMGMGETVDVAAARLQHGGAVVVLDNGHPIGILTRSDLLEFLVQRPTDTATP